MWAARNLDYSIDGQPGFGALALGRPSREGASLGHCPCLPDFAGQNLASRYLPRPRELVDCSRVGSCRISIFSPAMIKVATGSAYQCRSRNNCQYHGPRFLYENTIGQPFLGPYGIRRSGLW